SRPLISYMPNLAVNVLSHMRPRFHPRQIINVHRVNTALSMVRVRNGYGICPAMARPQVEAFGLAFVPLSQPAVTWNVSVYSRQRKLLSPAVESFLNFTFSSVQEWQRDGESPTRSNK